MAKYKNSWLDRISSSPKFLQTWLAALSSAAAIAIVLIFAVAWLPDMWSRAGRTEYGAFGDFVGGLLNPVLTFITFVALIFTILLQQRELSLARDEFHRTADAMERENAEATIFRLAEMVRDVVRGIDIGSSDRPQTGTDAFRQLHGSLQAYYAGSEDYKNSYEQLYGRYGYEIGHYFRVLYNSFVYIKDRIENEKSGGVEFRFYARMLRAQLSDYELAILYYNQFSSRGEKFQDLAIEFALFDNMNPDHLLDPQHKELVNQAAWGQ